MDGGVLIKAEDGIRSREAGKSGAGGGAKGVGGAFRGRAEGRWRRALLLFPASE